MMIWKDKVIIVRSSQQIFFFKRDFDEENECDMWQNYHTVDSSGFVSGNKKFNRFQLIEDKFIYFYEIDEEDFTPKLLNTMVNFMECGMMIFSEN